jgi:hypothetical protein
MTRVTRRVLISGLVAAIVFGALTSRAGAQGNGNGNGGSSGNGGKSGNGKGRGKDGSSNAGGNGNGKGGAKSAGPSGAGNGGNAAQGGITSDSVGTTNTLGGRPSNFRVRHNNGFEESLSRGRYTLKDNRGRTIVDRTAAPSDYARLRRLSGS